MSTAVSNNGFGYDGGVLAPSAEGTLSLDRTRALRIADAHGRYADAARRGKVFYAANQAATAWSVALTTTYTGLVISNPAGSTVNLEILTIGFGLSVAPAAIASIGAIGGYLQAGLTAHTTPLTPGCTLIGSPSGIAKADAAATLVGTPVWLCPLMGGFTAAALPATGPAIIDVAGLWVVPPGGYFGIGALTAVTGFGAITWEEVPATPA